MSSVERLEASLDSRRFKKCARFENASPRCSAKCRHISRDHTRGRPTRELNVLFIFRSVVVAVAVGDFDGGSHMNEHTTKIKTKIKPVAQQDRKKKSDTSS